MTDQPEPKYKIGDWVQLNSDIVTEIESIVTEPDDDGPFYYISFGGGESIPESDIKCAVAIHPIEHHKCKDCKHFAKYSDDDNQRLNRNDIYWWSTVCPLWAWARDAVSPCGAGLNLARTQIGNNNYDYENLEPPPDCYCFTPKLSPDEKESLKQSENDFATGNVLTKDEAFEKLGWKEL